jgi:hypothetical protein
MSSTVANASAQHEARVDEWKKVRATAAGRAKVIEGDDFVKRLPGHDTETYTAFKGRGYFLNATARSIEGLVGLLFRKAPQAQYPDALAVYAEDLTRTGQSAAKMAEQIAEEILTAGCVGVLIDHPETVEGDTVAAREAQGVRPYARLYAAESILGWKETTIGAERVISQVRLKEAVELDDDADEFKSQKVERVRVLDLENGAYRVRVFEKVRNKGGDIDWVQLEADRFPQIAGQRLNRIPFRFVTQRGAEAVMPKPPLLDLADVNCAHFNDSCLYQWGIMWTANPTPCFVNLDLSEGEKVALGSSGGLSFREGGSAFFLEFGGQGLGTIRQAMEDKRRDMAVMGARMLMEDRRQVEAAETAQIHRAGENSILAAISFSISEAMEWALDLVGRWAGISSGSITFSVNKDFMPAALDGQTLTALMQAWQGGGLSSRDLFDCLQRGELIREDKTYEDHEEELDSEPVRVPDVAPLMANDASRGA